MSPAVSEPSAVTDVVSVAVDALAFVDDSKQRGIGTYLRHLIDGVGGRAGFRVEVLTPPPFRGLDGPAGRLVRHPRYQELRHELLLPRMIDRSAVDLFHSPAQSPPRRCRVPWVQTLHDLTPLALRQPAFEWEAKHWLRVGPRLLDAAAVICDSQSSADQAVRFFQVPTNRLHVVPLGVEPIFIATGDRFDAGDPYLLWVSAWGPHKGFDDALEVIALLAEAGLPHQLLVAGPQHAWGLQQMNASLQHSRRPDRVKILGFVDDLPAVYRGADALVVTSRAEGFCLPAVEAMACGVPVVAYDNTALPERVAGAGVLVADGDAIAFARAVQDLLADPKRVAELRAAGLDRAAATPWSVTIDRYVEIYQDVLTGATA